MEKNGVELKAPRNRGALLFQINFQLPLCIA
jgi:hypothetical protein